jgi:hypothetical protein
VRAAGLILLLLLGAGVIASRFWPDVNVITVEGNVHHSKETVAQLARVAIGDPFLWVTGRRISGLTQDPWVLQAAVVRSWPDRVNIAVRERVPILTDGTTTWADDGTVLVGATGAETDALPRLQGWGEARVDEALELTGLLLPFGVQVISYSPEGFEILLEDSVLFTPGAQALRQQWSAFVSHRGGRIAVYPWGVSKANE